MTQTPEDIAADVLARWIEGATVENAADMLAAALRSYADEMVAEAMANLKSTVEIIGHGGAGRGGAGPATR